MTEITDTTLRDAHQSLISTRLSPEDAAILAELIDNAGFYSLEVWGGATFDVDMRYLEVDPWKRLEDIRSRTKRAKLQMLLRGRNLVGYKAYHDSVIEAFVSKAYEKGIDIFRIFDALNDTNNLRNVIKYAKKTGAIVQGAITYTISPVHTIEYYLKLAESILSLGADVITIKDMAGLLDPYIARRLVTEIKKEHKVKVSVHTHDSAGLSAMTYFSAIESGADYIDTSIYPLAYGTAQPAIQSIYYALSEDDRGKINLKLVEKASEIIKKLLEDKYSKYYNIALQVPDPRALKHQIPGGMYSNMIYQLKEMSALDKLNEALEEVPRVRKELGWPPLVTPMSQIVGAQAVLNVISGERYSIVIKELTSYVLGKYGKPPAPIDEEIKKKVLTSSIVSEEEQLTLDYCKKKVNELIGKARDEDVISYCLFPNVAEKLFSKRETSPLGHG